MEFADLAEDLTSLLVRGLAEGGLLPGEWAGKINIANPQIAFRGNQKPGNRS